MDQAQAWARAWCYFAPLPFRQLTSWAKLLSAAATDITVSVWAQLPTFQSLAMPPPHVASFIDAFIAGIHQYIGPLPVTQPSLKQQPHKYLQWFHFILAEFRAVHHGPHAPRIFNLLHKLNQAATCICMDTTTLPRSINCQSTPSLCSRFFAPSPVIGHMSMRHCAKPARLQCHVVCVYCINMHFCA